LSGQLSAIGETLSGSEIPAIDNDQGVQKRP
jgi:hypothetical protein